jgi:uncharacterized membrane protein
VTLAPELLLSDPTPKVSAPAVSVSRPPRSARWWATGGGIVQLLVATGAFHAAVLLRPHGSAVLLATAYVFFVPGTVALRALGLRPWGGGATLLYTVGASLATLYAVVLAVNTWGPSHGIAQPLATRPVISALDAATLFLAVIASCRRAATPVAVPRRVVPACALLLIPLVVAGGTQLLENRNSSGLVIAGLVGAGAALLWATFEARARREGNVLIALYTVALALLWSFSLRSKGLYGFDIQQEFASFRTTAQALRWTPLADDPYSAMLSINALPTALWQATGLNQVAIYKLLFPAVFALYPVGIYLLARHWIRPSIALLTTSLLFLTSTVASQMPALARQEIALVLFVGMLLAAFDRSLSRGGARLLVLLLGSGMIVSHYSTTYVALGAFVGARVIALGLRIMRRPARKPVISLPVVVALIGVCALWTVPVTHSDNNVTRFATSLSSNGSNILPQGGGQSLLIRWLAGNVTQTATPRAYFDDVSQVYAKVYPWLGEYTFRPDVQAHFPATPSSPPVVRPWQPGLRVPLSLATTFLRQASNLGVVMGCLGLLVMLRRRRIDPEVASLALALFAVTVLVRLSGSAAFAYNPERLAMQTAALLVVPLGLVGQHARRVLGRLAPGAGRRCGFTPDTPRRLASALGFVAIAVVFVDASGLGARASGGSPPGNLSTAGEYAERFDANDQDLAAAAWLDSHHRRDAILFADRYGALTLQFSGGRDHSGVFPDLTPGTLDTRAFIFASSSNILDGRARGTTPDNQVSSTYVFPTEFLNTYKAVIFDTGSARVYS